MNFFAYTILITLAVSPLLVWAAIAGSPLALVGGAAVVGLGILGEELRLRRETAEAEAADQALRRRSLR